MRGFRLSVVVLALPCVVLFGCPASQNWTTARTIPAGTIQHSAGVEWVGLSWQCPDSAGSTCPDAIGFLPVPFPAYQLRIGAADMVDLGFKASATGTFSFDGKIQLVRTEVFDLSLDPGVTTPFLAFAYVNMPILFSLNFGQIMTLTLYPKASYWAVYGSSSSTEDSTVDGFFLGGGGNIQIRVSERFAITPGFEFSRLLSDSGEQTGVTFLSFGIGFSFGSFPQFGAEEPMMQQQPPPPMGAPAPAPAAGPPVVQ